MANAKGNIGLWIVGTPVIALCVTLAIADTILDLGLWPVIKGVAEFIGRGAAAISG